MSIPLLDLKAQYANLQEEMETAVLDVMRRQQFINGPEVSQLEEAISDYTHSKHAVGVSSGTDALLCSLMALGIGDGDEVITTPYTFFATAGSIWRTGAKPVFIDIDPDTFNMDVSQLSNAITDKTAAIMPVHLFGQMAEMDPILQLAKMHDLAIIEDAAQAIGAEQKQQKAGSLGTVGCFSFFPSKNLGGLGDGGMITTQDPDLFEKLKAFRMHGGQKRYFHDWVGGNFRLDSIQAAGLLVKLKYLDAWSEARRKNAERYNQFFANLEAVTPPTIAPDNLTVVNQYVIRVPRRDELMQHLKDHDIGCAIYYPLGLHEQKCFASLGYTAGDFPNTEQAAKETLALPVYPELSIEQQDQVIQTIQDFYRE
jgi:dTDP-4-amino-4,6-dideoxygalactose transaminase